MSEREDVVARAKREIREREAERNRQWYAAVTQPNQAAACPEMNGFSQCRVRSVNHARHVDAYGESWTY